MIFFKRIGIPHFKSPIEHNENKEFLILQIFEINIFDTQVLCVDITVILTLKITILCGYLFLK